MICFRCCGPSDEEEEHAVSVSVPATPGPCKNEVPAPRHGSSSSSNVAKAFSLQELSAATDNFNQDCLIGEGGFGRVYKGFLHNTRQVVAVKQLNRNGLQGNREFLVEVLMLSLLHHPNLVSLIGYCADGEQRLLVYEFMPLGSLEDHLHDLPPGKEPLDWNTRMKIAAGAARGVEYLHDKADRPVIYRDLKSSNILLDEGYFPKLSDFGLAKLGPIGDKTHVTTRVMGTYGYCAPEYAMSGKLTFKSDVYSFGVVFLEIITGRKAVDDSRPIAERNLVAWAQPLFKDRKNFPKMADPQLKGQYPMRGLYQALAIAAMCLLDQAAARPVMRDVATAISYLASQPYDPNAPSNRIRSSARRPKELHKTLSSLSEIECEPISPDINLPGIGYTGIALDPNRGENSKREMGSCSAKWKDLETLNLQRHQSDNTVLYMKPARESLKNRKKDAARERAIAEAKLWGESWRERANEWIL